MPFLGRLVLLGLAAMPFGPTQRASAAETWTVVTGERAAKDLAILAAIEDLQTDGDPLDLAFEHAAQAPEKLSRVIVVGDATRNPLTASLVRDHGIELASVDDPQGFQVLTATVKGAPVVIVAGGSMVGDVYGLYWFWDRMRVHKRIAPLNIVRRPRLRIRLAGGRTLGELRGALRHTATWVTGAEILDLVPWEAEPEAARNAANRAQVQKLIDQAHGYHLKFLARGDEFASHPALLAKFGAKLDPADPALWQALQEKYRRLLRAIPGLDGVQIRTGELTTVYGNYRPFDVMHDPASSDWSLERRYRTFVQKMHEVVVGEFDRIYFHRTWVTNTNEQHSDPAVYQRIFTDAVPTRNLYLSPYMSLGDRWYYQPYNPTFNRTPHKMLALLATLDYHAGAADVFPSFPGQYHQGGLQSVLAAEKSNVVGVHFAAPAKSGWSTGDLTAYTVFRLAWDPNEDLREIARDYAAIHLGPDVASDMAEIILLSYRAYKDGIYIKPVAESIRGNTLPHLRLTTFRLRGIPEIDRGRAHIEWLASTLYAPSKERIAEALAHLDRGLEAAVAMEKRYAGLSDRVKNRQRAAQVGNELRLTRCLVEINNRYVRACFAYFRYREQPGDAAREALSKAMTDLKAARRRFVEAPGFAYHLYGVDQLIRNADAALDDLEKAERMLAAAPAGHDVEALIATQQKQHAQALTTHAADAVKVMHWRGRVDGRDVLCVRGKTVTIEHLQSDRIVEAKSRFATELPAREVTVLVKDLTSRDIHPFLLEQPTAGNDFTAKVYLFDPAPGYGWWDLELYSIDARPRDLGLKAPWD